jgi:hypothetical protein
VPVLIESDQCVFLLSGAYLVETIGATSTSEMQGRFLWNGSQNVVQGAEGAWHLQPLQDDLAGPTMNFQEWMDYWKVEPLVEERIWAGLAAPSRPVHTLVPADFLLPLPSPTTESTPGERPLTIGPEIENLPQRSPTPE